MSRFVTKDSTRLFDAENARRPRQFLTDFDLRREFTQQVARRAIKSTVTRRDEKCFVSFPFVSVSSANLQASAASSTAT